jgi:3D (Asp-Asp-Asp) domain-containing protein
MNIQEKRGELNKVLKNWEKTIIFAVLCATILVFDFPRAVFSQTNFANQTDLGSKVGPKADLVLKQYYSEPSLPSSQERQAQGIIHIPVTAYNSEVGQTDSSPFTTAFGTTVRDGIIAANFLPKGTMVRFPEEFGDKIFVVEDRMNARYTYKADIWMAEKKDAIQFGVKYLKMEIL